MKEITHKDRIVITDPHDRSDRKLGWRFYLKGRHFVDISDEFILRMNGQKKGEEIILNLEKESIHQFNLN